MTKPKYLMKADMLDRIRKALEASDHGKQNDLDIAIAELLQSESADCGFESMTLERQQYLATYEAEGYINGGGFLSFFDYTTDDMIGHILPGYKAFGADEFVDILSEAFGVYPGYPPLPSQAEREEINGKWMDNDEDPFESPSDKFMTLGAATSQRLEYVLSNPSLFILG